VIKADVKKVFAQFATNADVRPVCCS